MKDPEEESRKQLLVELKQYLPLQTQAGNLPVFLNIVEKMMHHKSIR